MRMRHLLVALAGVTLIGTPALAQRGGGHGNGGVGGGMGGGMSGGLGLGRGMGTGTIGGQGRGFDVRTDARLNSQGPLHANERARTRVNGNSVLSSGDLDGDGVVTADEAREFRANRRANSQGALHANARAIERSNARSALHSTTTSTRVRNTRGITQRTTARANSQARLHAAARARARANANSVIKE